MIIISVVVVSRRAIVTERFDQPLWPLTGSSLVVTGSSRGGGIEVDRAKVAGLQYVSLKSKYYYFRDRVFLRWLLIIT